MTRFLRLIWLMFLPCLNSTKLIQTCSVSSHGNATPTRIWFIQDSQNSVIAITNNTGFILEGYEYHPYGDPVIYRPGPNGVVEWGADDIIAATSSYSVVNLYTGREWDHESGLYHYRSRYMSPIMGKFISSDTIGVWGDANNLGNGYAYVGNGPYDGTDPMGEKKCKWYQVSCKLARRLLRENEAVVEEAARAEAATILPNWIGDRIVDDFINCIMLALVAAAITAIIMLFTGPGALIAGLLAFILGYAACLVMFMDAAYDETQRRQAESENA
jgi:RHS repeat-associated protein